MADVNLEILAKTETEAIDYARSRSIWLDKYSLGSRPDAKDSSQSWFKFLGKVSLDIKDDRVRVTHVIRE